MLGIARAFVTRMRVAKLAFSRCFQNDESCTHRALENSSLMKFNESGSSRYVHTWPILHTPHIGPPVRFKSNMSPCRTRSYGAHLLTLNRDSTVFRPSKICPRYGSTKTPKCRPMRGKPSLNSDMMSLQKRSFCKCVRRQCSNCLNQTSQIKVLLVRIVVLTASRAFLTRFAETCLVYLMLENLLAPGALGETSLEFFAPSMNCILLN